MEFTTQEVEMPAGLDKLFKYLEKFIEKRSINDGHWSCIKPPQSDAI